MNFGKSGFRGGPFGFRFYGPMGFGGLGFGLDFEERAGDQRRHQLRWLRRYKEDLEEELREVEERLKALESEESQAGPTQTPGGY